MEIAKPMARERAVDEVLNSKVRTKDEEAELILRNYIASVNDVNPGYVHRLYRVFVVWKCKVLQNWKYIMITDLPDLKMYELTYNGDNKEWYLDEYAKIGNRKYTQDDVSCIDE